MHISGFALLLLVKICHQRHFVGILLDRNSHEQLFMTRAMSSSVGQERSSLLKIKISSDSLKLHFHSKGGRSMTDTVLEKRRFPRKLLEEPAQVLDNDTGQLLGVLEDVSKGGFSLLTNQIIRQDEVRNITLVLPGPQKSYHQVSLIAECVWYQSGSKQGNSPSAPTPGSYAAGFQLREIDEQDQVALNYFIRDY